MEFNKMTTKEKIKSLDDLKNKGCTACRSLGVWHCAHPDECGAWDELDRLEKEKKQILIAEGCELGLHHVVPVLGFENSVVGEECQICGTKIS